MAVSGMPKGSKLIAIIIALVLIVLGAMTLSNKNMWEKMPGVLHFTGRAASLASCGVILLGLGLLFMQGMKAFENTAFLYNFCMAGFYGAGGLGAVMIIFAFIGG